MHSNGDEPKVLRIRELDCYNRNRFIFHAKQPVLAESRHEPSKFLKLKWIETRQWTKRVKAFDQRIGVYWQDQMFQARAANFFHLNLESGAAEIKLESFTHTDALKARKAALQDYRELAAATLGLDDLVHLSLAPAIRRALAAENFTRVSVKLPKGGIWQGKKGDKCPAEPNTIPKVVSLQFVWPGEEGEIRVTLDGQIDEIEIHDVCSSNDLAAILELIRDWCESYGEAYDRGVEEKIDKVLGSEDEDSTVETGGDKDTIWTKMKKSIASESQDTSVETGKTKQAIDDYLSSHDELNKAFSATGKRTGKRAKGPSKAAVESFLRHIKKVSASDDERYNRQLDRIGRQERLVFSLRFVSTILALLIVVAASTLIMSGYPLTVAIPTGLVGILSGGVAILLRQIANPLRLKRARIEEMKDHNRRLTTSIEASLISDKRAMEQIAETVGNGQTGRRQ